MSVAHDATTESATYTTTSPHTYSHTPAGTPRGVLVGIVQSVSSTDSVSAVTYGGVAMSRIATAVDTAGEPARVYVYFLGASIPTGAQNVSITHDGSTDVKWSSVITVTANDDTEVTDFETLNESQANPAVTIDTDTRDALSYIWVYSGRSAPSNLAPGAMLSALNNHDFGGNVARNEVEAVLTSGSRVLSYTSTADHLALVAVALSEVLGASTQPPRTMHQFRLRRA